jgi:hypothetical protein
MSHYAKINENNIVEQVIVAEEHVIASGHLGDPQRWIQTSYNTYGGLHKLGGTPLRKNYAGVGMIYDAQRDAFYWPRPENSGSWVLNEQTCQWERPQPSPSELAAWCWNETQQAWFKTDDPTLVGKWIL